MIEYLVVMMNAAVTLARRWRCLLTAVVAMHGHSARAVQSAPSEPAAAPTRMMGEVLIIDRTGRAGRSPVHTDAIEAQIVAGAWQAPKAGDTITAADGSVHTWSSINADQNGSINHESLQGGYACWNIESDQPGIMRLRASGHDCGYINGEIRTGDPYRHGIVTLPVQLRPGVNTLLFRCSRGGLLAQLSPCPNEPFFDASDATLPDLIVNRADELQASIVIVNPTLTSVATLRIEARIGGGAEAISDVGVIPPLGIRKAGFSIRPPASISAGSVPLTLTLRDRLADAAPPIASQVLQINVVQPGQLQRRTYVSSVDGSVQFWALLPANPQPGDPVPQALILTLHGADVEATNQAAAYAAKSWAHMIAPTNRRKYGFDWEDWGRIDAMDVLDIAQRELGSASTRTYLTGHSMGGHGTWQIGATFPDRFLAIGPSAGWISFWSYSGAGRQDSGKPIERMFRRASNPSDTLALSRNHLHHGIYILHGDQDDNVPVEQARQMRKHLAGFHPDFAYYEQPGAGHWWGNPCVDWPPMMQFFRQHQHVKNDDRVEFITANPGVSCESKWVKIEAQFHPMEFSSISISRNPAQRLLTGTTSNVRRLSLNLEGLNHDGPMRVELDGQSIENIAFPVNGRPLRLERRGEQWSVIDQLPAGARSSVRNGPFKDAFRHRMIFVYGTHGTTEENAWALNKARYDAETFWYRGNGSIDVIPDSEFDPAKHAFRNVIIYGNADTNSAWDLLLKSSPVQVRRDFITIGDRRLAGDDLATLFIRPRANDDECCIGVIGGTGIAGMRLTDRLPYFVSGVAYPDLTVFDGSMLSKGIEGVRAAGFFGDDWSVETGEIGWREP